MIASMNSAAEMWGVIANYIGSGTINILILKNSKIQMLQKKVKSDESTYRDKLMN